MYDTEMNCYSKKPFTKTKQTIITGTMILLVLGLMKQ